MVAKLGGRPAKPLKPAKALVTKRVRHLIDLAHDGNVHEASKVSGVPSATLRALYTGRITNPELKTLERLGDAYGFYAGWFTDPKEPEAVPVGGYLFAVSEPMPKYGILVPGEFTIPWASWPLPDVVNRYVDYLLSLPPTVDRPIIGDLVEKSELTTKTNSMVAAFLLAPLFLVESMGQGDALRSVAEALSDSSRSEGMYRRMRKLGLFWQDALSTHIGD